MGQILPPLAPCWFVSFPQFGLGIFNGRSCCYVLACFINTGLTDLVAAIYWQYFNTLVLFFLVLSFDIHPYFTHFKLKTWTLSHYGVARNLTEFCDMLQQFDYLVGPQYKSQELAKSDWAAVRKSSPWAIDSWGLGMFSSEVACHGAVFSSMVSCS